MGLNLLGFTPAKILSYDQAHRTAQISIAGLTDGAEEGLTATFAYPVGDSDFDTEREILAGADVSVYFDGGQADSPVIAFYRSHGEGAVRDVRRIRQANIEVLARVSMQLTAPTITLTGRVIINGDIEHTGNQVSTGTITGRVDVIGGVISVNSHTHGGVMPGSSLTLVPSV